MRQVPVPEGWSDIFSGHFEPFLRLSNRKISQRRPFRHGSFHLIFPRFGHGLGQDRKPAAQKLRRCKQRIAPDFCRFPGRSARSSARCPSGSVFASDSRHRSGRCARHSRCATQNCRSATSGKAVDVGSVASSAKREQIAVQEIAPVGVVDLSVQEHVVITAQSALSHIERPLVAVKEKGVRSQFASIENHFFDGNLQKKQTKNIVTHFYNPA